MEKKMSEEIFSQIKNKYILQIIFKNLSEKKLLDIIRHNYKLQKRLNKDINNYKEYLDIEIELELTSETGKFINILNESYYKMYINNYKKEIKNNFNYKL